MMVPPPWLTAIAWIALALAFASAIVMMRYLR